MTGTTSSHVNCEVYNSITDFCGSNLYCSNSNWQPTERFNRAGAHKEVSVLLHGEFDLSIMHNAVEKRLAGRIKLICDRNHADIVAQLKECSNLEEADKICRNLHTFL